MQEEKGNWERKSRRGEKTGKKKNPIPTKKQKKKTPSVVYAKVKDGTYTACRTNKKQGINVNAGIPGKRCQ